MNTQHIRLVSPSPVLRGASRSSPPHAAAIRRLRRRTHRRRPHAAAPRAATPAANSPTSITIGYQYVPNGDLVVKHRSTAREGVRPRRQGEWKLFDSGGDVNEAVLPAAVDIGLVGSSPTSRGISSGIPYEVPWIFDVIGNAEALVVKGDKRHHLAGRPQGQDHRHPVRLDVALQPARRARRRGCRRVRRQDHRQRPGRDLAAWTAGRHRRRLRLEPQPGQARRGRRQGADHQRRPGEEGQDHVRPGDRDHQVRQPPTRVRCRPGSISRTRRSTSSRAIPDAAAADIAAELNITPEEAKSQLGDLVFVDAATQAGSDYLGGGLSDNLYASAQFNKELGKIDSVPAQDVFTKAVVATYAAGAS